MRMHDQSFGERALERMLKKGDFRGIPAIDQNKFRSSNLAAAKAGAHSSFNKPANPLGAFELKKKTIYTLPKLSDELVVRKLCDNLRRLITSRNRGRAAIVANLSLLLEEGTPYRIYRLDVKSFYESFDVNGVCEKVKGLAELSPMSKALITSLLESHVAIGGHGIPRGLALSASLSDLMMQDFDNIMISHKHVFFYARYVDDIIIITSAIELKSNFQHEIETTLPSNLKLNSSKNKIVTEESRVRPAKLGETPIMRLRFDYLGYTFSVYDPQQMPKNLKAGLHSRAVTVDIAKTKVKKLKTRLVRSFLDFKKNGNFSILLDRVKFLTQNFSVYNSKVGSQKLAGIFHSYPQVTDDASSLIELDQFLKHATLSKSGRLFSNTCGLLSSLQKRQLLAHSFVRGHADKSFVHFSAVRISEIQKCWLY